MTKTIQAGERYTTRDGKTVVPKKLVTGNWKCDVTGRYFTPEGKCIAYYRGNDPILEENRSIVFQERPGDVVGAPLYTPTVDETTKGIQKLLDQGID